MGYDTVMMPTSITIDGVLDENSISNICNSLDKTSGDPFFYNIKPLYNPYITPIQPLYTPYKLLYTPYMVPI